MPKIIVLDKSRPAKAMQSELRKIDGCQVCKVVTASSARDKAATINPDLLIFEPNVTGDGDGLEAVRDIKERQGLNRQQIIVTSETPMENLSGHVKEIASTYIRKPWQPDALREIVGGVLAGLPKEEE